jgi:hypothetical protein
MPTITKAAADSMLPPAKGQAFIRDDKLRGFALRITAAGIKSFVFEGACVVGSDALRSANIPRSALVSHAMKRCEIKSAITQGRDPVMERAAERKVLSFRDLTNVYLERYAKSHKRSWKRDELMLAGYLASWSNRRLSEVTTAEVARLHERLARENGRYAANRTVALLRTMFNLARDWGYVSGDNPASRVKFYREENVIASCRQKRCGASTSRSPSEPNLYWRAYFP